MTIGIPLLTIAWAPTLRKEREGWEYPDTDCTGADGQEVTSGLSLRVRVPGAGTGRMDGSIFSCQRTRDAGCRGRHRTFISLLQAHCNTIINICPEEPIAVIPSNSHLRKYCIGHALLPPGLKPGQVARLTRAKGRSSTLKTQHYVKRFG